MKFKLLLKKSKSSFTQLSLSIVALGLIFTTSAQTNYIIGTQTGTSSNVPLTTNYGYNYTQQIYTAADLNAVGITGPAEISQIGFYLNSGTTTNSFDWTVYIGNSTKTSFTTTTDWEVIGNLQNSFSGTVTFVPGGWMQINLTTPFQWNGVDNIVVAVDENQANWGSLLSWRKSDLGANRSMYYRSDGVNPDPSAPPTATGRFGYVPNIRLLASPSNDCVGAPVAANILANDVSLCIEDELILTLDSNPFEAGYTYQWQAFDGADWTDLTNDTLATLTTTATTDFSSYQVVVGCEFSGLSTTFNPIAVTVNELPIVAVDLDNVSICPSVGATINASGADSYAWLPITGLNNSNTASVIATPTTTTTYTVSGTDANGCIGTAESTIIPYTAVNPSVEITPTELCEPGTPVAITVGNDVPANSNGGTWNYRFLNADGVTEAQTWNATNVFNYIPTEDSVYTFFYQLTNTSCATDLDSVEFSFAVGFGGDVTTIDYDCINLGGTVEVSNSFGQTVENVVYTNDFSPTADMSAVTTAGNASITNEMAVITPSQTSTNGNISISNAGIPFGPNNAMTVTFDMTIDLPIVGFGFNGADGMSYSFGNDATPTGNGNTVNGRGSKLRLCFDTAPNANGNVPGTYLVYGMTNNNEVAPGNAQTLAFTSNTSLWHNQTNVPVELSINGAGKATVTIGGEVVFANIALPPSYLTEDVSTWNHFFTAGTGGAANRHAIDNFEVTTGSLFYGVSQGSATTQPSVWQNSSEFTDLAPGTYHVWLSKDETGDCAKNIETIEILNTNPLVELGNDTTICEGETLILDAQNAGATYNWSNTQQVTQTIEVSEAGAYVAYVTAANGCVGIGTINVEVEEAPSATGIFMQGQYPNYTFTVLNAENADAYDWNFGDGGVVTNGPATVNHVYWSEDNFTVTATLSNDCGSTVITDVFTISTASLSENTISGLVMYPNPATNDVTIQLDSALESVVTVNSASGSTIVNNTNFNGSILLNTSAWESGIYFVQITNQGTTSIQKLVIK